MPAYGQSGFGAAESFGLMQSTLMTSGGGGGSSSPQVAQTNISSNVMAELASARAMRDAPAQAFSPLQNQAQGQPVDQGFYQPAPASLSDMQDTSPKTLADKWTQSLASIPAEFRPFVDDVTLNCMASEGAIANAEDYMHGLVKAGEERESGVAAMASEHGGSATEQMLAQQLASFGPAGTQLQKCGELMLALIMASGREDLLSLPAYAKLYDATAAPYHKDLGMLKHYYFHYPTKTIRMVPTQMSQEAGSAAPPTPEDQLNPPQYQEEGSMSPASAAPVENDTVLFTASETAAEPAGDVQPMSSPVPQTWKQKLNQVTKKPWFPYAAGGAGLALILFMRK